MNNDLSEVLIFLLMVLTAIMVITGIGIIKININRNVFNTQYKTNYTLVEWFFAEDLIKNYLITGEKKRLDVNFSERY